MLDIWGDTQNNLGLSVSDYKNTKYRILFFIDGKLEQTIDFEPGPGYGSFWFKNKNKIFTTGSRVDIINRDGSLNEYYFNNVYLINKIRGTEINNIFIITLDGKIFHFNGLRWKMIYSSPAILNDIYVTDNFIVAVGNNSFDGLIVTIKY